MPRANRYILPGYIYHLTHRCHNRKFLFRFDKDKTEYRKRLRLNLKKFKLSLISYCITSNHIHLLIKAITSNAISRFMQKQEGEFAEYYNIRKNRRGAFWEGRYKSTMIDNGEYLWNCMKYIDLNMVRAGVIKHPQEWEWGAYRELIGMRKRYCLLDIAEILEQTGTNSLIEFTDIYKNNIKESISKGELARDEIWTENIAVGSKKFADEIAEKTKTRVKLVLEEESPDQWTVKEPVASYS